MRAVLHHFGPYQIPTHVTHCLCADGKRRRARITAQEPDTYFSIPACVKIGGVTVSGHVYMFNRNEEPDYHFMAVKYGKNYAALPNDGEKGPKLYVFQVADASVEGGKRYHTIPAMTLEEAKEELDDSTSYELWEVNNLF